MHDDGVAGQILQPIGSETAVFALVFLDSSDIVRAFVDAQIVFVSESSSACWTGKGSLVGR
jgi:hypothetical protein